MGTAIGILKRFEQFDSQKAVDFAFTDTTDDLAVENRKQMYEGKKTDQSAITPKYASSKYAKAKNEMNPKAGLGNPDLYVTGAYHKGITVKYEAGVLQTASTDPKAKWLEKRYTGTYGLGGEFKKRYVGKHLRPALHIAITRYTGFKFRGK